MFNTEMAKVCGVYTCQPSGGWFSAGVRKIKTPMTSMTNWHQILCQIINYFCLILFFSLLRFLFHFPGFFARSFNQDFFYFSLKRRLFLRQKNFTGTLIPGRIFCLATNEWFGFDFSDKVVFFVCFLIDGGCSIWTKTFRLNVFGFNCILSGPDYLFFGSFHCLAIDVQHWWLAIE